MIINNEMITFKSEEAYYRKEKSGCKNNTVRILSENEYDITQYSKITRIEIINSKDLGSFTRGITDISRIGAMCGKVIVVFTWRI